MVRQLASILRMKVALAHLIRGSFVAAYINEVQLRTGKLGSSPE
jgi:hypothetical protein